MEQKTVAELDSLSTENSLKKKSTKVKTFIGLSQQLQTGWKVSKLSMDEKAMAITPRTPEKVHHEIAYMLANGVNYIDALVEYARIHELEIEVVADIVKKSSILKEKVRTEAVKMKLVIQDDPDITELC
jgi:predicted aldo/keto reductase-like oxidoreductase